MTENTETKPLKSLNIHQRMVAIMSELHYIQKGDKTVNGQYRFVSHDQVVSKVRKMLVKHGVNTLPSVVEIVQDGNCTRILLDVTFVNVDWPEDRFTVRFPGFGIDGGGTSREGKPIPIGDKGPGKAISYAYKYCLLKQFNLETGDDPDNDVNVAYEPPKCVEFDEKIPVDFGEKDIAKMSKFLQERAKALGRNVEDIKREAVKQMPEFLVAFKKWEKK